MTREKQAFINRMRIFASLCEEKSLVNLTVASFDFPPEHVNVDDRESRIRYLEEQLLNHKCSIGKPASYFSDQLWTSKTTINDDLAKIRKRQNQPNKHDISVKTTENEIILTLNKSELLDLLNALLLYTSGINFNDTIARIVQSIWVQLDDYSKERMRNNLHQNYLETLDNMLNISLPKISEDRWSPHEEEMLLNFCEQDPEGWYVLKENQGIENWFSSMLKSYSFRDKVFQITYHDENKRINSFTGSIVGIDLNTNYLSVSIDSRKKSIKIPSIQNIRFRDM